MPQPPDDDTSADDVIDLLFGDPTAPSPPPPPTTPAPTLGPLTLTVDGAKKLGLTTVEQIIYYINSRLAAGDNFQCPCCTSHIKRYKRPLSSTMVRWLIYYVRYFDEKPGTKWLHVTDVTKAGLGHPGDFAKLRYWGFIEERPQDEDTKDQGGRTTGYWRPTSEASDFVNGNIKVESHAQVTLGVFEGLVGDLITIKDALGKKFDYTALMQDAL